MQLPKIDRFLASDAGLQPLVRKAREIRALAKLCEAFLPPELARLVRAANFRAGRLVLLAANPAAAAKLKMLSESLADFLLKRGAKVNSVSVRVQPERVNESRAATQQAAPRRPPNIAALSELCESLGDSPAKRALEKFLAREARFRSPAQPGEPPRPERPRRARRPPSPSPQDRR